MYTIADIPKKWAKNRPDEEAVVCYSYGEYRLTWKQLKIRINKLGNSLLDMGLKKGEHVAILMDNNHQYMEIYYAMATVGIIPVPLNVRLHKNELKYIITNSDAIGIIIEPAYKRAYNAIMNDLKNIKYLISVDQRIEGMIFYEDLISKGSPEEPEIQITEDDLLFLCYTGGTTGLPKGVMISHRNFMNFLKDGLISAFRDEHFNVTQDDSTLLILPAFHIAVWPAFLFNLVGAKVVMINKFTDFEMLLQTIEKEKVAHLNSVPTLYNMLINYKGIENYDLSSVKLISSAGEPYPTENLKKLIDKFGPIVLQALGATEGGPWSLLLSQDITNAGSLENNEKLRSAGMETLMCERKIVDEHGKELEEGEIGELIVKTKSTMMGYWKNPEKTKQVLKDGWYWTGDLGYIKNYYLYLVDRKNDTIKSGGEKVYPFEVENMLYKHPSVAEAIVVGVPDPKWGEKVHATIRLRKGYSKKIKEQPGMLEQEIKDFCREHLASYKIPKTIQLTTRSLPKSVVGKLLRKEIRKKFEVVKNE